MGKKEKRLYFVEEEDGLIFILNTKDEYLGSLKRMRVGRWMSYCLTGVPDDAFFSAGCMDEIREQQKELNSVVKNGH